MNKYQQIGKTNNGDNVSIWRRKPIDFRERDESKNNLTKSLGVFDLTALGIGAIIGTGIFVLTGIAAAKYAGPGLVISFIISGVAAVLAAMIYAEMATAIPLAGSAYTYSYVTLGEYTGWLVGWNLVLEYAVAAGAVSAGWSAYLSTLFKSAGYTLPKLFTTSPLQGGIINLPAVVITLVITFLLISGSRQGSLFNRIIVIIKLSVILVFLFVGATRVNPANWHPFLPFGFTGAVKGAAIIFFAYIGFDAVATAAEEVRNPEKNLPMGIISSLGISTILYILVALVLTGLVSYRMLNTAAPVATALLATGIRWGGFLVSVGAMAGLSSVLFATIFAQSRIFFAMSRDGLIPSFLSQIHPRYQSPYLITIITGIFVALIGGFLPVYALAEMANIGTLTAFFVTSIGVLVLERIVPPENLSFRVPFAPYLPILSAVSSGYLALNLPAVTWIRFVVWVIIGTAIYLAYGYRHSKLAVYSGPSSILQPIPLFKRRKLK
ncbi:MAG: amino acid permease [Chitinophagales bacterium]